MGPATSSATARLFDNHQQAAAYSRHRPTYPPALYDAVLGATRGRDLAVDIGTGSGQAAVVLAEHFQRVVAQDGSAAQLQHANRERENVTYEQADACATGLTNQCADLVTVAQALHW
jgi:ubiquinone/menaquinone biosynthesis C-methylase UbiE